MTAPETPPQDLSSASMKLATRITGLDIDSPATSRIADAIEAFARTVIWQALETLSIDMIGRVGPMVRELVRTELRRAPAPAGAPRGPFERMTEDGFTLRVCESGGRLSVQLNGALIGSAQLIEIDDARELHAWLGAWLGCDAELANLRAQVADLQEHARRQHALDGERLRDIIEINDGALAWRGMTASARDGALAFLDRLGGGYRHAACALRALTHDPERARLREELEEARNQQDFPGG